MSATIQHPPFFRSLYFKVLLAILLGVILGVISPSNVNVVPEVLRPLIVLPLGWAEACKPLGDAFVKVIRMLIAPIIFCTVVHGIASMRDLKKVGRVGLKALIYFEGMTTVALAIGMTVANTLRPGHGMNVDAKTIDTKAISGFVKQAGEQGVVDTLMHIIPNTVVSAFAEGDILQILFFAVLFAIALQALGERGAAILRVIEEGAKAFFGIVGIVMRAAPLGAFGAMAFTIGRYGIVTLVSLGQLMASFYATCLLFVLVALGVVAALSGFSIISFIRYIKEELLIVLGTSSSESALPGLMQKMEAAGVPRAIVGVVVPTGYSFNLDGTNIYMTLAALFIAQACKVELTMGQQVLLLGVAMLSSKGAAGVTGAGFITLAATLAIVPSVPIAGMTLILGVDRFMSECRSLTNFMGNAVATLVIARWEGTLDRNKLSAALGG